MEVVVLSSDEEGRSVSDFDEEGTGRSVSDFDEEGRSVSDFDEEGTGVIKFWGCHKILGPPCDWGPPGPILPVGWGPRRELGAPPYIPHRFFGPLYRTVVPSACQCLSVSSAIKKVPNMPNHQCIMEETEKEASADQ